MVPASVPRVHHALWPAWCTSLACCATVCMGPQAQCGLCTCVLLCVAHGNPRPQTPQCAWDWQLGGTYSHTHMSLSSATPLPPKRCDFCHTFLPGSPPPPTVISVTKSAVKPSLGRRLVDCQNRDMASATVAIVVVTIARHCPRSLRCSWI